MSGFQDGETLVYLVYDESNEFGLPASERSEEWLKRAQMTFTAQTNHSELPEFPDRARHLLGHYYVIDVYYG